MRLYLAVCRYFSACFIVNDIVMPAGVGGAQAGTLTFMVGADEKAHFEEAAAILKNMGKNIVHCGAVGTGQVCVLPDCHVRLAFNSTIAC